jgi:hypothetical protein
VQPYRCYFLDPQSKIRDIDVIEAETDAEALERAETVFRAKGARFSGYEVWDRERHIHHRTL